MTTRATCPECNCELPTLRNGDADVFTEHHVSDGTLTWYCPGSGKPI